MQCRSIFFAISLDSLSKANCSLGESLLKNVSEEFGFPCSGCNVDNVLGMNFDLDASGMFGVVSTAPLPDAPPFSEWRHMAHSGGFSSDTSLQAGSLPDQPLYFSNPT